MKKIPVIAVVGPTASGKTSLSINIAKQFSGQVVSADSMQIYEKMDIFHHIWIFLVKLLNSQSFMEKARNQAA